MSNALLTPPGTPGLLSCAGLARELLAAHRLPDWSFGFNRSKVHMGLCLYGPRVIQLSTHFVERNPPGVLRDTLLHEIAHALVGPGHGHGPVWKAACLRVGARPERLSFDVAMPAGRWQARCGGCGLVHHKHRRPRHLVGWWCAHCGPERGRLTWACTAGGNAALRGAGINPLLPAAL